MTIQLAKQPIALAVTMALTLSSALPTNASHKSGVPPLDFALKGVNLPGWTSLGECANDRPGQGCLLVKSDCNGSGYDLYSTEKILNLLITEINGKGRSVVVNTMSESGHFINRICSLTPK